MVNTDPVWTTLPYSYIQRWYAFPSTVMLRFQLVHYNYSTVSKWAATRASPSLPPFFPILPFTPFIHALLWPWYCLHLVYSTEVLWKTGNAYLFIITFPLQQTLLDQIKKMRRRQLMLSFSVLQCLVLSAGCCSLLCTLSVRLSLEYVRTSQKLLLTFFTHCIFSYFLVTRKQGSRVLCLGMSLSIIVWNFFLHECSTLILPCSFITGYTAFRNALHTWGGRF